MSVADCSRAGVDYTDAGRGAPATGLRIARGPGSITLEVLSSSFALFGDHFS